MNVFAKQNRKNRLEKVEQLIESSLIAKIIVRGTIILLVLFIVYQINELLFLRDLKLFSK